MTARTAGFYWVISEPGRKPSVARWDGSVWHLFGDVTSWTQDTVERVSVRFLPTDPPASWVEDD